MNKDIPTITNNGRGASFFSTREIELIGTSARLLSEQIPAENFRLRHSDADYVSDWHVAGDPTLLIILSGTFRIELRSGEQQDFSAGELFIAEDYLAADIVFNEELDGHRAEVVGPAAASALHLKLNKRD